MTRECASGSWLAGICHFLLPVSLDDRSAAVGVLSTTWPRDLRGSATRSLLSIAVGRKPACTTASATTMLPLVHSGIPQRVQSRRMYWLSAAPWRMSGQASAHAPDFSGPMTTKGCLWHPCAQALG